MRKENNIPHQHVVEYTDILCKLDTSLKRNMILTFFLLLFPLRPCHLDCSIIRSAQILPAKIAKLFLKSEYHLVIPELLLLTIVFLQILLLIFLWSCYSMPFCFLGTALSFSVRRGAQDLESNRPGWNPISISYWWCDLVQSS